MTAPTTRFKSPSELLLAAFQLFEGGRKWTKNHFTSSVNYKGDVPGGNCFCALGAIRHLMPTEDSRNKAENFLLQAIRKYDPIKGGMGHVPSFNDRRETEFEDIKQVFEIAIQKAHEAGE